MYKLIDSKQFHHMNATVETVELGGGAILRRLVSYTSVVCDVCENQIYLYPRHRYSSTTTRQVARFLSEQLGFHVCAAVLDDWLRRAQIDGYVFENGYYIHFPVEVLGTKESW